MTAPVSLFDTHCHIDVSEFDADRLSVMARARRAGLEGMLVPAVSRRAWAGLAALVAGHDWLHAAYGCHPCYTAEHTLGDMELLGPWLESHRAVAVGEIGLDFFVPDADVPAQRRLFEAQLSIASSLGLPVILHARKSHDEVLGCLRRLRVRAGIVHAWSGSEEQARRFVEAGFLLGFGGATTYERALKLRRLVTCLPLESLVLETDAPDIAPAFARGERNSPEWLPRIAEVIADVRGIPVAELAAATTANARRLFGLPASVSAALV